MGNYGRVALFYDRHSAVGSHAIGSTGNYGRVVFFYDRHRAVGSHAIGGMGNYGRVALLMTGRGPSVRTPSGAWATMDELLFLMTGTAG
jgi:hypothetical protein